MQRLNKNAAKRERKRDEEMRNTIVMEDNPLRSSRARQSAEYVNHVVQPPEYINVALQNVGRKAGVGVGLREGGEADGSHYSQIAETTTATSFSSSAPPQHAAAAAGGEAAAYAVPNEAMLSTDARYADPNNHQCAAAAAIYSVPMDVDGSLLYQHPEGGTMYASSA